MHSYSQYTDAELVQLIACDDSAAFSELYERYKGLLYLHACKMLDNKEDAKDILQDIFTNIWNKRKELSIQTNVSAYLYRSVKNKILDFIARQGVKDKYIASLSGFLSTGYCLTDSRVREKELQRQIEKEVARLPDKMRKVFELSRAGDLSYREIAEALHISGNTVKKQVSNALTLLKGRLLFLVLLIFY